MAKKPFDSYTITEKTSMSIDEVGKRLNIFKTFVFNSVKKQKKTGKFVDAKLFQGHLKQLVKGVNWLSLSNITSDLNQSLSVSIIPRAVFNYLKKSSYEYKIKLKKQWLNVKHYELRMPLCKQHGPFRVGDW